MQEKSEQLLAQVQKILSEYSGQLTLRQIYYQLVSRQVIQNNESEYRRVSRLCVIGRDEGILPEDKFIDRLRQLDMPNSWEDLADFMETVRRSYRKDYWISQPCYIEIWSEKDALRSVMSVAKRYGVSLMVCRGHASRTAIYETSLRYKEHSNKELFLFYFGDHDPSGHAISNSLFERLSSFDGGLPITFSRVALNVEQIQKYNLPQDPAKEKDPNYKKFIQQHGDGVAELDALPPAILTQMIEECIRNVIEWDAWNMAATIEKQENKKLVGLCKDKK
jgi:hypothetical protein